MQVLPGDDAVVRAKAGDMSAFRGLVESHSREVFRLAYRMTRNEEDAEDIVQETFIRAYQRMGDFEQRASFSTWLYRITANAAIDLLRRRKRVEGRNTPLEDADSGVAGEQEKQVFGRQVRESVNAALGRLSALERAAFVLRHSEELSLSEISATLDITVNATKQAIFRAVKKLRSALAGVPRTAP